MSIDLAPLPSLTDKPPMSLQSLSHRSWLRTALAALILCFALGTIAQAGHHHAQSSVHMHVVCDYCAGLGDLIDAPRNTFLTNAGPLSDEIVATSVTRFIASRPAGAAQARAPPVLN